MTWLEWIDAVIRAGQAKGLIVTVTHQSPVLSTFYWRDPAGPMNGVAGAGADMIYLTTPEQFTYYWQRGGIPTQPQPVIDPRLPTEPGAVQPVEAWERRGRHVPRVPARATSLALSVQGLFQ